MKRSSLIEMVVFLYAVLFLYTAISKLADYDVFKQQIAESPILKPIAKPIAWGLPWLEFGLTILLIIPKWRLKGLYASLALMIFFTGYVGAILMFDKKLPCSCGGIIQQLSWPQHILFNTMFIALAIWAIILEKSFKQDQQKTTMVNFAK